MTAIKTLAALSITALTIAACAPASGNAPQTNNANNDFDASAEQTVQQEIRGEAAVQ